jgi:Flp pilus assembly protein TadG
MTMRKQRGSAIIEFALMMPLILLLLAGVLDYTLLLRSAIALTDAARAGAQYGSLSSASASDIAGMQATALNAAPDIANATATATKVCKCSDGSTITCGTGSCVTGVARVYVQVTVQATNTPLFSYSQLPFLGKVGATATMRAQ